MMLLKQPLPANLKVGTGFDFIFLDDYNKIAFKCRIQ
jgi:hypothetical protein